MQSHPGDNSFALFANKSLDPKTNSVCHCVLLKLKTEPEMKKLQVLLTHARLRVPGLLELHFGKNDMNMYKGKNEGSDGNTHALFSRHYNSRYLSEYQKHPAHVELSRYILSLVDRPPSVVDFVNVHSKL